MLILLFAAAFVSAVIGSSGGDIDTCAAKSTRVVGDWVAANTKSHWPRCKEWLSDWPSVGSSNKCARKGAGTCRAPTYYFTSDSAADVSSPSLQFEARNCVHNSSHAKTVDLFHGLTARRVIVVGDSISSEFFFQFVCDAAAATLPNMKHLPRPTEQCVQGWLPLQCVEFIGLTKELEICMVSQNRVRRSLSDMTKALSAANWLRADDVAIFNFGMHSHYNATTITIEVGEWLQTVQALSPRPHIIWRETSPQHFETTGGLYNSAPLTTTQGVHIAGSCVTDDNVDNPFNVASNPLVERAGLPVLRIFGVSHNADHVSSLGDHHKTDCTHFHLPGPTLALWVQWALELATTPRP